MRIIKFILPFFLLLSFKAVYAQSRISGMVVNASNVPLPFSIVTLQRTADASKQMSEADSTGIFYFSKVVNGAYLITVTNVGYESFNQSFDISHDTSFIVQLQQSSQKLNEVTVTGMKPSIEQSTDKVVYNLGSSVAATGGDALQAISQVP